jgi:hypothetical protein
MKKILIALNIAIWSLVCFEVAHAEAVVKEVCTPKVDKAGKPVMDKKTKEQAQDCKKIKTHKKVEGDKVPDATKKK